MTSPPRRRGGGEGEIFLYLIGNSDERRLNRRRRRRRVNVLPRLGSRSIRRERMTARTHTRTHIYIYIYKHTHIHTHARTRGITNAHRLTTLKTCGGRGRRGGTRRVRVAVSQYASTAVPRNCRSYSAMATTSYLTPAPTRTRSFYKIIVTLRVAASR